MRWFIVHAIVMELVTYCAHALQGFWSVNYPIKLKFRLARFVLFPLKYVIDPKLKNGTTVTLNFLSFLTGLHFIFPRKSSIVNPIYIKYVLNTTFKSTFGSKYNVFKVLAALNIAFTNAT